MKNTDRPEEGKLRKRDAETTVAKLKAAAAQLLVSNGFAGLSIQPILAEAGVSKGAMFHHFPSKNHLIAAAFEDLLISFAEQLETLGAGLRAGELSEIEFVEGAVKTFASDMFVGSMEIALGIRVEPELSELVEDAVIEWRARLESVWTMTFSLPGYSQARTDQHWAMASNLLRGHAFTSTFGVEPGAKNSFCQEFKSMILGPAVVREAMPDH